MNKILKLFIINIMLMFSVILPSQAKDVKFIQVTDIHFNSTQAAIRNFDSLINKINNTKNLDFVAFSGDNIDTANKETLRDFLTMAKKIKVPYYVEIGNHDCFRTGGLSKDEYLKIVNEFSLRKFSSFNFVVKKNNLVFIFLDGAKEMIPAPNGYFKNDTIAWLEKQLDKNKKKKVVIIQHFPIVDIRPNSNHNLIKPEQYNRILSEHNNVIAIFAGHYHSVIEVEKNGIYHIVTGAASGYEPMYREILIQDNGKNNFDIFSQCIRIDK